MGSVNGAENCPLCDTPLTVTVKGVTLHFTAHTPEDCRFLTVDKIRMPTKLVQSSSSVETAEQQRMKCEYGKYADRLKGLLRENDIAIPHERWYAEDMERLLSLFHVFRILRRIRAEGENVNKKDTVNFWLLLIVCLLGGISILAAGMRMAH